MPERKKDDLILDYQDQISDMRKASIGAIGLFVVACIIAGCFMWESARQKERADKAEETIYNTTITKTGIKYGK